jgi:formate dehydrogenase maturation protein FdhE
MASGASGADTATMPESNGLCPSCKQGDLITISMSVGERDLTFTTCHLCESKWWERDGSLVPLASVIDLVVKK